MSKIIITTDAGTVADTIDAKDYDLSYGGAQIALALEIREALGAAESMEMEGK